MGQNDPIYNFKAIKNKRDRNIKLAHLYDGSALTKYLFWVRKILILKRLQKLVLQKTSRI